ncbi:MAG: alpha-amylase family protein [Candidatus Promineifilaceae bacterium]
MNKLIRDITDQWTNDLRIRWQVGGADALRLFGKLYGNRADFGDWVIRLLKIVEARYEARSAELHQLDYKRLLEPDWYQSAEQVGYVAYTDRFADTLSSVADKIPYLKTLGITYLHLMPLLEPRDGANDGGYAVADYRNVNPQLGNIDDLRHLTTRLHAADLALCIDLVCNHTATDHEWAQRAKQGEQTYQDYYLMFPDRSEPDAYDKTLREIFPEFKRGNFVYHPDIDKWVWTTFNTFQWDLNYRNPAVFCEMLDVILFLANCGVDVLRMDAVAFMWKQLGTDCENLPEAHTLLQAWRALSRLVAPGLLLLAEAIVAPEDVIPYFGEGEAAGKECELAYHNSLMVYLWSALAEKKVALTTYGLQQLPQIPNRAAWINYVRVHDDIGWAITDANAAGVGLDGFLHRSFLSDYYCGKFPGSDARGLVFQFNSETGDRRINGSCASLAGLEVAIERGDPRMISLAIGRILLIHSIILVYGGIPTVYMGDELGMLNNYDYTAVVEHKEDSRWVHRPKMDWISAEKRHDRDSIIGRIFHTLQHMIATRKKLHPLHAQAITKPVWTHNNAVLGIVRESARGRILGLGNFSPEWQVISARRLNDLGFDQTLTDHLSQQQFDANSSIPLAPYQSRWLQNLT